MGGWVASRVGLDVLERRKSLAVSRIRTPDSPPRSIVTCYLGSQCVIYIEGMIKWKNVQLKRLRLPYYRPRLALRVLGE
jgi:hypothetical protein